MAAKEAAEAIVEKNPARFARFEYIRGEDTNDYIDRLWAECIHLQVALDVSEARDLAREVNALKDYARQLSTTK